MFRFLLQQLFPSFSSRFFLYLFLIFSFFLLTFIYFFFLFFRVILLFYQCFSFFFKFFYFFLISHKGYIKNIMDFFKHIRLFKCY